MFSKKWSELFLSHWNWDLMWIILCAKNEFPFIENSRLIESISNRETDNQSQAYAVSPSLVLSPNGQSTSSSGMFNSEMGRKTLDFSPDHIVCLCEALQQKGDIDKLAQLLYNLPKSELIRPNDSILRWIIFRCLLLNLLFS